MEKIKIVWLCHFVNNEMNSYYGTDWNEHSRWITEFVDIFKCNQTYELHVIAPNYFTNKDDLVIVDGVYFHFYKYHAAFLNGVFIGLDILFRREKNIQKKIYDIVSNIQPKLIHLFGSENRGYSSGIIPLRNKYPIVISLQGFISLSTYNGSLAQQFIKRFKVKNERTINTTFKYFTIPVDSPLVDYFKKLNQSAKLFSLSFPTTIPATKKQVIKKYDIVFWGHISEDKGIEDLINALYILRKNKKDIKLLIVGKVALGYKKYLTSMIDRLGITQNVFFEGFKKTQSELFEVVSMGKIYVLPTHFDGLPGSIREAFFLKIPVITYPVGAIPSFNDVEECVMMAETRNVEDLSQKIWLLLNDKSKQEILKNNAYQLAMNRFSNNDIYEQLNFIYETMLNKTKC